MENKRMSKNKRMPHPKDSLWQPILKQLYLNQCIANYSDFKNFCVLTHIVEKQAMEKVWMNWVGGIHQTVVGKAGRQ